MEREPLLPPEPLVAAWDAHAGRSASPRSLRTWVRVAREGRWLPAGVVDRVCVEGLGRHPIELYGADWCWPPEPPPTALPVRSASYELAGQQRLELIDTA